MLNYCRNYMNIHYLNCRFAKLPSEETEINDVTSFVNVMRTKANSILVKAKVMLLAIFSILDVLHPNVTKPRSLAGCLLALIRSR